MDQLDNLKEYFQMQKFVIVDINTKGEVQSSVSFVDDFEVVQLSVKKVDTSRKLVCLESRMTIILWI